MHVSIIPETKAPKQPINRLIASVILGHIFYLGTQLDNYILISASIFLME